MDTNEYDPQVDADLWFCRECHEVSEGRFCPGCDHGRCTVCDTPVAKGEPFTKGDTPGEIVCGDPECNEIAVTPSVAEAAAKLAGEPT